jgi:hypothetical protein
MGFEPMFLAFERAKTVHALDRAVNMKRRFNFDTKQNLEVVLSWVWSGGEVIPGFTQSVVTDKVLAMIYHFIGFP